MGDYDSLEGGETRRTGTRALRPALMILGGALLIMITASILGVTVSNYINTKNKSSAPKTCVNMDQLALYTGIASQSTTTGSTPPDTALVVGGDTDGGRVITSAGLSINIFRKSTMERIWTQTLAAFFGNATQNVLPTYDPLSKRFFLTGMAFTPCALSMTILSPPAVAGQPCTGTPAGFGATNYTLTNLEIVAGNPIDGCAPFINAAALVGKIVLVKRGTCTFVSKAAAVQAAGGAAFLCYNNVGTTAPVGMGGTSTAITIPCLSIGQTLGNALAASVPLANATMTDIGVVTTYTSGVVLAVSKNDAPLSDADFYKYGTVVTPILNVTWGDFPRSAPGVDAFFVTPQIINSSTVANGERTDVYGGAYILALNKANLINGVSATMAWEKLIPGQFQLMPAELRTPLDNPSQPTFFAGVGGVAGVTTEVTDYAIYWGSLAGLHSTTPVSVPIAPIARSTNIQEYPLGRQPEPIPYVKISMLNLAQTAMLYQNLLWTATVYAVTPTRTTVRWMQFDTSMALLNAQVTLVQEGDLDNGPDVDFGFPHLDVDNEGNMMLMAMMTGTTQYPSLSYTGRLPGDPLGTLRYPLHIWAPGNSTYWTYPSIPVNYGWSMGGMFDPADRKTFWMYGQIADPVGTFINNTATQWTTVIGTARTDAQSTDCPPDIKTKPASSGVGKPTQPHGVAAPASVQPYDSESSAAGHFSDI